MERAKKTKEVLHSEVLEGLSLEKIKAYEKHSLKLFIAFFSMGLLNNNGFVLIGAASQNMATHFYHNDLMPLFQFSLALIGLLVRVLNTSFMLRFRHKSKIVWVVFAWCIGYVIFYYSFIISNLDIGFILALFSTIIIGCHTSLGAITIIGFVKALPPHVIGGFYSGTGLAGISGTAMNLIPGVISLPFNILCLLMIPTYVIYTFSFFWVIRLKAKIDILHPDDNKHVLELPSDISNEPAAEFSSTTQSFLNSPELEGERFKTVEHQIEDSEANINSNLNWTSLKEGLSLVGMDVFNLTVVFYLETLIVTSFAERANPKSNNPNPNTDFISSNGYLLLQLSYQVGVFLSRSSFVLFKFPWVTILTILQFINSLVFGSIAYTRWLDIRYQIPLMLWVGMMGGCSLMNCMYNILSHTKLKKKDKEVVINAAGFFNDVGILAASVSALVVSKWLIPGVN